ncbi:hypothetical protein PHLCEN_2v11528 [Hermanssonia centrifuga]|uniref:Uncharacterized protein n=1 Tax=Hermanssonia centrifuga TaxID=98765 RepID=A0A2R6NJR3_9APHY|nr:hypothetical protein PHLCEN_2v11528 [Hermanssonia centrifuga]
MPVECEHTGLAKPERFINHQLSKDHARTESTSVSSSDSFENGILYTSPRLPFVPGPASKSNFPPLDTWEDLCSELESLCAELGVTFTVGKDSC